MKKLDKNYYYKKKLQILEKAKKIVQTIGWTEKVFLKLTDNDINKSDLFFLFPSGYKDLLYFSIEEINHELETNLKKTNIINLPVNKRIKKILLERINILDKDKIFYKKTFYHLILPQNSKFMKKSLYKSVDIMWYLAGDNSTDFNFYTKRIILAGIYVNALFIFFNKNYEHVEKNIDINLNRISKIPKLKARLSFIKENLPVFAKSLFN